MQSKRKNRRRIEEGWKKDGRGTTAIEEEQKRVICKSVRVFMTYATHSYLHEIAFVEKYRRLLIVHASWYALVNLCRSSASSRRSRKNCASVFTESMPAPCRNLHDLLSRGEPDTQMLKDVASKYLLVEVFVHLLGIICVYHR